MPPYAIIYRRKYAKNQKVIFAYRYSEAKKQHDDLADDKRVVELAIYTR